FACVVCARAGSRPRQTAHAQKIQDPFREKQWRHQCGFKPALSLPVKPCRPCHCASFRLSSSALRRPIERTMTMAIKASFIPGAGLLSVFGDDLDNAVTISRNAAGLILINGGAVQITGGTPTVANTTQMLVFGQAGNDMLVIDESNGALPPAQMFGGAGNDTLVGGSGDDQVFGEGGNDRMIWNPGDDTDLFEGGDGTDTAEVNGGNG